MELQSHIMMSFLITVILRYLSLKKAVDHRTWNYAKRDLWEEFTLHEVVTNDLQSFSFLQYSIDNDVKRGNYGSLVHDGK